MADGGGSGDRTKTQVAMNPSQRNANPNRVDRSGPTVSRTDRRLASDLPGCLVAAIRNNRTATALVATVTTAFGALAILAIASEATLLQFDRAVQSWLLESRTEWLNQTMVWLTFLGTRYAIALLALGLLLWSWITKKHRAFVLIIIAAAILNPIFEIAFKELIDRVRPATDQLLPGNGPSFPSGHVLAAVGFYGLIPLLAWEVTRSVRVRLAALFGSWTVVAVVAVSRPYLDVHWATDAIAGVLLGTVLVVTAYQAYLGLPQRQQAPAG